MSIKSNNAKSKKDRHDNISNTTINSKRVVAGYTVAEWDETWNPIGCLKTVDLMPYKHCVGLYMLSIDDKIVYVGRAIELNNGGILKRLTDYRRKSDIGRKSKSGKLIFNNLDKIVTDILIVGNTKEAIETTKTLEKIFISKYQPEWNVIYVYKKQTNK